MRQAVAEVSVWTTKQFYYLQVYPKGGKAECVIFATQRQWEETVWHQDNWEAVNNLHASTVLEGNRAFWPDLS